MTALLAQSWESYTKWLSVWETYAFPVPYFPLSAIDFFNTLMIGAMLRGAIRYRIGWFRLLMVTGILSIGGTTVTALFLGNRPRWLIAADVINAVFLGYWLMFFCPGDKVMEVYRTPALQYLWRILRGIALAVAVSAFGIERVIEARATPSPDGKPSWAAGAGVHTFLIAGILSGCGGGLVVELTNMLLLPRRQMEKPWAFGPSFGVWAAILLSVVYTLLVRDPMGFNTTGVLGFSDKDGKRNAVAVLSIVSVALHLLEAEALPSTAATWLAKALPGFKTTLVPSDIGDSSVPREVMGYETVNAHREPVEVILAPVFAVGSMLGGVGSPAMSPTESPVNGTADTAEDTEAEEQETATDEEEQEQGGPTEEASRAQRRRGAAESQQTPTRRSPRKAAADATPASGRGTASARSRASSRSRQ